MATRTRRRERPERVLTVLLRRHYTEGYIQLSRLRLDHRRLQQWPLSELEYIVREAWYAGDNRFEYTYRRVGNHCLEMFVSLSPHLRCNRHGQ